MTKEESLLEKSLYFLTALVINLILFTLLSTYLLFTRFSYEVSRPITLLLEETPLLEEVPREEEVIFEKRTQRAGGTKEKLGRDKGGKPVPSLPSVATKSGDVPVASKETTETSILSEIERKVKSRKTEATQNKPTVSESFGELSGVVSGSGVDLAKSTTRKIVYIPPFPQLRATEPPSTFQAKLWVEPSGRVSKVEVLKRSGVPEIDSALVQ
ncbi:energy transducer TonB, partial [Thermocrinis sp.]|uniref:energy transducer TonB n=1 Tax=Thermocrinis sp. TaxID=2024383 RepID=UPI003C038BD9